ncbi:MAG TPA: 3-deoxy-7-phosphoheptulonate synthase, partial [Clostridiales bacterium]|nr:3-deoxy-7-phosphoheptulonate synthase [Clostridiales bacterium]
GNPLTHTVLRGAINKHGQSIPNYHYEDLVRLISMYQERDLQNSAIIIDANHANSNKQYKEQIRIVREVLHSRKVSSEIAEYVKGFMIESYIEEGSQKVTDRVYGKSITDPCIGWEDSEKLIYTIADNV